MTTKGVKLIHVNTGSIFRKLTLLEQLYSDVDFLCCSETWLDDRMPDNIVRISDMKLFRCDRIKGILDYNIHVNGGGVCIYVAKKWSEFTHQVNEGTVITDDFEIISLSVVKPNFKKLFIACIYKPPKGNVEKCLLFLKKLINNFQGKKFEIWILGDFNTDMLKRDDPNTVKTIRFIKKQGLTQIIDAITRPNRRGGSCIDLIMTDSLYNQQCGVLNDFVSDHYTIYCLRKKRKEHHEHTKRIVRDYSAFDKQIFENLLVNSPWYTFDSAIDPDIQWEIILEKINNILAVMCPFKKVNSRKNVIPWLTPEIYKAIREKKALVKKYKITKCPKDLKEMRVVRNRVNSLIDHAKSLYIQNSLYQNVKKPRKFWKIIKNMIDSDDIVDITAFIFKSPLTNLVIHKDDTPDFLNEYFVNISTRICGNFVPDLSDYNNLYPDIETVFEFIPPVAEEIYGYMESMDVNSSSCIDGINMKMCKGAMDAVPSKFRHLLWSCSYVTLIPKTGDKSQPCNWRPISQTNIFAKVLEKIVHKQLLSYFLNNSILTENQFGFLPEKSTHESIFNVVRHMYSCINNNKIMEFCFST